jgi:hypothetical protein
MLLAVENFVADFDFHFNALAVVIALAGAHGRDFAYLGLFLCCVGQKDAAGGFFFASAYFHEHALA